jgi:hypothetical protein
MPSSARPSPFRSLNLDRHPADRNHGVKQTTRRHRGIRGTSLKSQGDAIVRPECILSLRQKSPIEISLALRAPILVSQAARDLNVVKSSKSTVCIGLQPVELALEGGVDATPGPRRFWIFSKGSRGKRSTRRLGFAQHSLQVQGRPGPPG